ncbi:MAG TPA: glycosyltransferase [Candidatus Paceibacterota bacterium]|nr:glycosyltransferase [Candidatus Paceibacterota bacterium]
MRIAYFSDNFDPELSGITDTVVITGRELRKRGHEICYIGPRYAPKDYAKVGRLYPKDEKDDTIDGMSIARLPSFPVPSSTGQSRFALPSRGSFAHLKVFKPDIIHTQSPYGVGWEALRAAKHFRVPLIGTNHTSVEDYFPLPSVMRAYDAWYYNHCDFVTAPYEALIANMREKGFRRPARAVANPVELNAFSPATPREKADEQRRFTVTNPVVLFVGRLGPEKNIDDILRAVPLLVKTFPTLTFVMAGHGTAAENLKKLAQELGIEKNVLFTGFLNRTTVLPHLYKTAGVFVLMSRTDSQSIALMQSYASGIPAVCARARGLPDYTPEDCGFLVEPGDYATLAEKLSLLFVDEALRERMGKAAQTFVARFSPEVIAREWEQIYDEAFHR